MDCLLTVESVVVEVVVVTSVLVCEVLFIAPKCILIWQFCFHVCQ